MVGAIIESFAPNRWWTPLTHTHVSTYHAWPFLRSSRSHCHRSVYAHLLPTLRKYSDQSRESIWNSIWARRRSIQTDQRTSVVLSTDSSMPCRSGTVIRFACPNYIDSRSYRRCDNRVHRWCRTHRCASHVPPYACIWLKDERMDPGARWTPVA